MNVYILIVMSIFVFLITGALIWLTLNISSKISEVKQVSISVVVALLVSFFFYKQIEQIRPKSIEVVETKFIRLQLVKIDPPKHVYIDLATADGQVYKNQYVSKHCNKWKDNVIGDWYNIKAELYKIGDAPELYVRFPNLNNEFCN